MHHALLVWLIASVVDPETQLSVEAPAQLPCVWLPKQKLPDSCGTMPAKATADPTLLLMATDESHTNILSVVRAELHNANEASSRDVDDLCKGVAESLAVRRPRALIKVQGLPAVRLTTEPPKGIGMKSDAEWAMLPSGEYMLMISTMSVAGDTKALLDATLAKVVVPPRLLHDAAHFGEEVGPLGRLTSYRVGQLSVYAVMGLFGLIALIRSQRRKPASTGLVQPPPPPPAAPPPAP